MAISKICYLNRAQISSLCYLLHHYQARKAAPAVTEAGFLRFHRTHAMAHLDGLVSNASAYEKAFSTPLSIGVKQKLAIVTCMDSR